MTRLAPLRWMSTGILAGTLVSALPGPFVILFSATAFAQTAQLAHPIPSISQTTEGEKVIQLNLEDSVDRAIHQTTAVIKAHNDVDLSGERLIQGYTQFLPNLVATGGYNVVQGSSYLSQATPALVDGRNRGGNYQLASTFNIFNGFSDWSSLKSSLARKSASDLSLTRAKQLIALDVAQSFLQVILDRDIVKIAEKNLASSKAREDQLTEQTRIGAKNMADLFRQQALTSSDETYLSSSQDKQRTDELLFLRKLRLDPALAYDFIEPSNELTQQRSNFKKGETTDKVKQAHLEDEPEMIRVALEKRADYKSQNETTRALGWDVTAARAGYYPKVDFGLSIAAAGRTFDYQTVNGADITQPPNPQLPSVNSQLANQVEYSIGVLVTWNIFDRWITETNVERAIVTSRNSKLDQEDLRNQVVGEVRQAYGDYRTVLQQLESSVKGQVAAEKAYETVEGRYEVGSANFVDLTTAQAALVQADASHAQAEISYVLQGRILETVMGTSAIQ